MSSRFFVILLSMLTLLAGCSGRNAPTNPENEQWFCQSNETGEGWECVQDDNLALVPVPTRLPPEPVPEADPSDIDLNDPLDLDALNAPLERNPAVNPDAAQPATDSDAVQSVPEDTQAAAAATSINSVSDADPTATPPIAPQPIDTPADADSADPRLPRHVALAYTPPQPTQITQLPSNFFAVQMLAMKTPAEIETYIDDNQLAGMSGARVERDGEIFYVLIVGIYDTYAKADEAAKSLPPPLDDVDVWIRPLGSLQQAMIRADELTGNTRY